ncbi:MAG: hypothetical protein V1817_01240 [Candidatus Micrarchaeota archaeon]
MTGKNLNKIAFAALLLFALVLPALANAKLEPAAIITLSFQTNASGTATLQLEEFKAGLTEPPRYLQPALKEIEVRVLDPSGGQLKSFWFSDPRNTYYDVPGENGSLSGGKNVDANARFFFTVPLSSEAKYAVVFDANGAKLIAINLKTGTVIEEKEWKEIAPKIIEEKREISAVEIALAALALVALALILLGLVVFRKAGRGGSGRQR